jgi:hypothetical protein
LFITVCRKFFLVGKSRIAGLVAVLYAAPVVFGAVADFRHVRDNAVSVAAVRTVKLIESTQVAQFLSIKVNVVTQLHALYVVQAERYGLVYEGGYMQE